MTQTQEEIRKEFFEFFDKNFPAVNWRKGDYTEVPIPMLKVNIANFFLSKLSTLREQTRREVLDEAIGRVGQAEKHESHADKTWCAVCGQNQERKRTRTILEELKK